MSLAARRPGAFSEPAPMQLRVLWIDDEVEPGDATVRLLGSAGIEAVVARSAAEGLRLAAEAPFPVILLDFQLPDLLGLTVLRRLRADGVTAPVFVVTGHYGEPEVEADALQLGAAAFLRKPLVDIESLAAALRASIEPLEAPNALSFGSHREEGPGTRALHDEQRQVSVRYGIVAASDAMRDVLAWIEAVGPRPLPVLLTGETGTGKEVVARALHTASGRRGRFVAVNCGAIPDTLFESELFGHAKGAYTGAADAKAGLLETAEHGTLFLDEVGDLSAAAQVRLLRVLDGDEVRRLGETRGRALDVRMIAATNRDLQADVTRRRFREDLYYRLKGAARHLPPLRDRPEDIAALAQYWAARHRALGGRPLSVAADALRLLRAQRWPGNARELRNTLERAACFLTQPVLSEIEIAVALSETGPSPPDSGAGHTNAFRAEEALRASGGNATRAARLLRIGRATFYRWLRSNTGSPGNTRG